MSCRCNLKFPFISSHIGQLSNVFAYLYVTWVTDLFNRVSPQPIFLLLLGWITQSAYGMYGAEIRRKHVC